MNVTYYVVVPFDLERAPSPTNTQALSSSRARAILQLVNFGTRLFWRSLARWN
jgi:hypothetical protein